MNQTCNRENKKNFWTHRKWGNHTLTFSPLSMYLTATSSSVCLSLINLATPKLPDPISLTSSYRSLSCMIGMSMPGPTVTCDRSINSTLQLTILHRRTHSRHKKHGEQRYPNTDQTRRSTWRKTNDQFVYWLSEDRDGRAREILLTPNQHQDIHSGFEGFEYGQRLDFLCFKAWGGKVLVAEAVRLKR